MEENFCERQERSSHMPKLLTTQFYRKMNLSAILCGLFIYL
jgi:hypothetical protein